MKVLTRMTSSKHAHKFVKAREIKVFAHPGNRTRGIVVAGPLQLNCSLGAGGLTRMKREGDGATPVGRYRLLALKVRRDRVIGPRSAVPAGVIRPDDACRDRGTRADHPVAAHLQCQQPVSADRRRAVALALHARQTAGAEGTVQLQRARHDNAAGPVARMGKNLDFTGFDKFVGVF